MAQVYYGNPTCCAWSADGACVAAGGEDDLVTVYSVMEQRVVAWCEGHTSWVTAVCFDPWYVQVTCSFLVVAVLSLRTLYTPAMPACLVCAGYGQFASCLKCSLQFFVHVSQCTGARGKRQTRLWAGQQAAQKWR